MKQNKPYIICHMMTSIDGKIASGTGVDIFDDEYLPVYDVIDDEHNSQGWMCGRTTMEMFGEDPGTPLPLKTVVDKNDYIFDSQLTKFSIAVDTKGALRWKSKVITSSLGRKLQYSLIVLVIENTPQEYLAYLQSMNISYLIAGQTTLDWDTALAKLHDIFGITKLSLQGGGKINGSLLKAGLIDELSVLLIPFAVNNSNAPSLFENQVRTENFKTYGFSLRDVKKLDKDVVWLRYTL